MKKIFLVGSFILLVGLCFFVLYIIREIGSSPTTDQLSSFERLSYFRNGRFCNTDSNFINPKPLQSLNYKDKFRFFSLFLTKEFSPKKQLPMLKLSRDSFKDVSEGFSFYWLGHNSAILELNGKRIGIDLVLGNASPIPFTVSRHQLAPLERTDLPEFDYIIITHNHYDHLERKTVTAIKRGHFIVPLGVGETLRSWGISSSRITELGWNDTFEQDGFKVIAVESRHFSGRWLADRNLSLWCSYIIESSNKRIFWSGDTGYGKHFIEIAKRYGPFDFCALEIDAWNDKWPTIHLFPDQTVQAAEDLGAKFVFPMHWGVYILGFHHWRESIDRFIQLAKNKSFKLVTPIMGERCTPGKTQTSYWWQATE